MMTKSVTHLAGIITIAGWEDNFNFPWPPCMMPIGRNYLAIEYAAQCAVYAGCETIWIVSEPHIQKIIKKRLGDYIPDLSYTSEDWDKKKEIPIFYIPIPDKFAWRAQCYEWCMAIGALTVNKVSARISKHVVPEKYLFISPYVVVDEHFYFKAKQELVKEKQVKFKLWEKSRSSTPIYARLPFTASLKQIQEFKKDFDNDLKEMHLNNLTKEQLKENIKDKRIFIPLDDDECSVVECSQTWELADWQDYCDYVSSGKAEEEEKTAVMKKTRKWQRFVCEDLRKEKYTLKEYNDGTEEI